MKKSFILILFFVLCSCISKKEEMPIFWGMEMCKQYPPDSVISHVGSNGDYLTNIDEYPYERQNLYFKNVLYEGVIWDFAGISLTYLPKTQFVLWNVKIVNNYSNKKEALEFLYSMKPILDKKYHPIDKLERSVWTLGTQSDDIPDEELESEKCLWYSPFNKRDGGEWTDILISLRITNNNEGGYTTALQCYREAFRVLIDNDTYRYLNAVSNGTDEKQKQIEEKIANDPYFPMSIEEFRDSYIKKVLDSAW